MPNHITIIGAGFSGTVLAAHLLRQTPAIDTTIALVERSASVGRGVAYAVRDWPYLLNVPAGRLSADLRDPLQFLRFAQGVDPRADAEDFLPRELYGDYLQDVLQRAEQGASDRIRLVRISGEVLGLARRSGSNRLDLKLLQGQTISTDRVVLAVGNPPPNGATWANGALNHPAFLQDPWYRPVDLGPDKTVVIVGTGLTMADIAISLTPDLDRAPRLISISRHGLLPLRQSRFHATAKGDGDASLLEGKLSALGLLRCIRQLSKDAEVRRGDWREVITAVRHAAPRIWQNLPPPERRRFLRHLRSYWDVHRHRLPPQHAARIEKIRAAGKLQVDAGRIVDIRPGNEGLEVVWRKRGAQETTRLRADLVINATGPDTPVSRSSDPLLTALCSDGWLRQDELALGLSTSQYGACVDRNDTVSKQLFYLGPMLRAEHWEATAATELRDLAQQLATHLMETLER